MKRIDLIDGSEGMQNERITQRKMNGCDHGNPCREVVSSSEYTQGDLQKARSCGRLPGI